MEEPLDKVMTMILFGVLKKNAATVVSKEPLKLQLTDPLPAGLNPYEADFLKAFDKTSDADRRKQLQTMTISLVESVSNKMKGFSRKETIAYYKDINERAWKQVEAAQTPEVKSETYDNIWNGPCWTKTMKAARAMSFIPGRSLCQSGGDAMILLLDMQVER